MDAMNQLPAVQASIDFFEERVSTMHPDPELGRLPRSVPDPSGERWEDFADRSVEEDSSRLVRAMQIYICRDKMCMRRKKRRGLYYCRFGAPWSLRTKGALVPHPVYKRTVLMATKRNHARVNSHRRRFLRPARANGDCAVIVSKLGVIRYMAKYHGKAETRSKKLLEQLQASLARAKKKAGAEARSLFYARAHPA